MSAEPAATSARRPNAVVLVAKRISPIAPRAARQRNDLVRSRHCEPARRGIVMRHEDVLVRVDGHLAELAGEGGVLRGAAAAILDLVAHVLATPPRSIVMMGALGQRPEIVRRRHGLGDQPHVDRHPARHGVRHRAERGLPDRYRAGGHSSRLSPKSSGTPRARHSSRSPRRGRKAR